MRRLIFATVIVFLLCNLTVRSQEDPRNQISGPASIMAGSTAEISWRCMDATAVVLSGDTTTYPPVHTLSLRPTGPITLRFRVCRSTDTSSMTWSVGVRPQDTTRVMRGGSILSYSFAPSLSTGPSSYYRGYDPRGDRSLVSRVRILRVDPPDSTHDDYLVQAALLDTSGNNIASIPPSALDVVASLTCDGAGPETEARGSDILWTKSPRHVVMTVCMDRSAFARSHDEAVRSAVADFTYSLGSGDQLSVVGYNIETTTVCPHAAKQKLNDLRSMFSGEAEGLSALYRSAYACLGRFDGSGVYDNTLVIIASGQDNASLIYSADDVISRARARKTRIFTIGIGDMVDSYILQLLASRTGGRAYFLQDDGIAAITDILREIDYGIHGSYAFRVPDANPAAGSCDTRILSLGLRSASFVSDSVPVLSDKDYSI
ncbi:MAG: vWA domain-containing protein, partial [Candidatus Kapaibacterium sp.]